MSVDYIKDNPDFTQEALDRVLSQFKNKENYNKLITLLSDRYAELFSKAVEIPEAFLLKNAVGSQLDEIGKQLKISRKGYDDDEIYRRKILLYIGSFRQGATRDEITTLLQSLATDGDARIYKAPGNFIEASLYAGYLTDSYSGGEIAALFPVNTELVLSNRETERVFGFAGAWKPTFGFGDASGITPGAGGNMSGIIYQTTYYEPEK